jgi:hypothetical protein
MVVGGSPPVRVGRRQANVRKQLFIGLFFCYAGKIKGGC